MARWAPLSDEQCGEPCIMTKTDLLHIYRHIAMMCGNPNPSEGCRLVVEFCKHETGKLEADNG